MFPITYSNKMPEIGPVKQNGKQEIKIQDYENGCARTIETDSEKIDTFVSERKKALKKTFNKAENLGSLAVLAVGIAGIFASIKKPNSLLGKHPILPMILTLVTGIGISELSVFNKENKISQKFIEENK